MTISKFQNNQSPNPNNQTITNDQMTNNQTRQFFGNWLLDIGICLVIVSWLLVIFCVSGCERIDPEALNKIIQEDPSFKTVLEKKQDLDSKIAFLLNQERDLKNDTYAKVRTLEENFNRQKREIDSKITGLKNELDPERTKIRQETGSIRDALSGKKEVLKSLENTKRNLTNLINQQKAVSVTEADMAKWQERLTDLNSQIEPLLGEVRELEDKLRMLRLKLVALRQ